MRPALSLVLAFVGVAALAAPGLTAPNDACFACHARASFDPIAFEASVHGDLACGECHRAFAGDPHGQAEVAPLAPDWLRQVVAVESPGPSGDAWGACGACHPNALADTARSAHLRPALEQGLADGAFCRDCHGPPHTIEPAPRDPAARLAFVSATCVPCHTDATLIERYDLNPDVVFTYEASLHGRAARLGSRRAPTCVDCHAAHAVSPADDPDSPIALGHRAEVCQRCHDGANENFASLFAHQRLTREGRPAEYWATFFFVSLTVGTIALLMLHILLDFLAGLRLALRRRRS